MTLRGIAMGFCLFKVHWEREWALIKKEEEKSKKKEKKIVHRMGHLPDLSWCDSLWLQLTPGGGFPLDVWSLSWGWFLDQYRWPIGKWRWLAWQRTEIASIFGSVPLSSNNAASTLTAMTLNRKLAFVEAQGLHSFRNRDYSINKQANGSCVWSESRISSYFMYILSGIYHQTLKQPEAMLTLIESKVFLHPRKWTQYATEHMLKCQAVLSSVQTLASLQ